MDKFLFPVIYIAVGLFFGHGFTKDICDQDAIDNGVAYYDSKTAKFTWRDCVKND